MTRLAATLLLTLAACSKAPTPADTPEKQAMAAESGTSEDVATEKKSIEEAADAAAKLVEAEAREEIGALEKERSE